MFIREKTKRINGLTLLELMVSMTLMSIVVVIVFFIYLTASRAYLKWQSESSFTDSARLIVKSLNNSIADGLNIIDADNSSLTLLEDNLKQTRFEVNDRGKFYRNDMLLSPGEFEVVNFNLRYAVGRNGTLAIKTHDELDTNNDFKVTDDELEAACGVEYSFILKYREKQNYYDGLVMMRNF